MELRTANVTRYIMPLREGGSLPAFMRRQTMSLNMSLSSGEPDMGQKP